MSNAVVSRCYHCDDIATYWCKNLSGNISFSPLIIETAKMLNDVKVLCSYLKNHFNDPVMKCAGADIGLLCFQTVDELIEKTLPSSIRLQRSLKMDDPVCK